MSTNTVTVDMRYFKKRHAEMLRQIPIDWQEVVRDTTQLLVRDFVKPSGKFVSNAALVQKPKVANKRIRRDINRAVRPFPLKHWKNKAINKYIQSGEWRKLEQKFVYMKSDNRRVQEVREHGLNKFTPNMHESKRNEKGQVPKGSLRRSVLPDGGNSNSLNRYKATTSKKTGMLSSGWLAAGMHFGTKGGAFLAYVKKHGTKLGGYVDGTRGSSDTPFTRIRNWAPGVGTKWFVQSYDRAIKFRSDVSSRLLKTMVQHTYKKFNADQSLRNNYKGES